MSQHQVRSLSRKVKLYRDHLIDNSLIIDDAQDDFLQILHLIFDNARAEKQTPDSPSPLDDVNKSSSESSSKDDITNKKQKSETQKFLETFETASSVSLDKCYRRFYREIIKKVHPDRYSALGIETEYQVKRAKKIFQNAKMCAESSNEQGIVELCAQLEVDMSSLDPSISIDFLKDSESQLAQRIQKQEKSLQMLWYYNVDNLDIKTEILMAYIQQSGKRGKNITETLVKDVVASYNKDGTRKKRKVGQRPAKLKR